MNKYFKFEPVLTLAALQVLGAAVITLLALLFAWPSSVVVAVTAVVEGVWAVAATLVRGAVTPVAKLEALAELSPSQLEALRRGELGS